MSESYRSLWNTHIKRYAIGQRSDLDMSIAVADLIKKLRHDFIQLTHRKRRVP